MNHLKQKNNDNQPYLKMIQLETMPSLENNNILSEKEEYCYELGQSSCSKISSSNKSQQSINNNTIQIISELSDFSTNNNNQYFETPLKYINHCPVNEIDNKNESNKKNITKNRYKTNIENNKNKYEIINSNENINKEFNNSSYNYELNEPNENNNYKEITNNNNIDNEWNEPKITFSEISKVSKALSSEGNEGIMDNEDFYSNNNLYNMNSIKENLIIKRNIQKKKSKKDQENNNPIIPRHKKNIESKLSTEDNCRTINLLSSQTSNMDFLKQTINNCLLKSGYKDVIDNSQKLLNKSSSIDFLNEKSNSKQENEKIKKNLIMQMVLFTNMKNEMEMLKKENDYLTKKVKFLNEQINNEKKIELIARENNKRINEINYFKNKIKKYKNYYKDYERLKNEHKNLIKKNEQLIRNNDKVIMDNEKLKEELIILKQFKRDNYKEKIDNFDKEKKELINKINQLTKENINLNELINEQNENVNNLENNINKQNKKILNYQEKIKLLQEKIDFNSKNINNIEEKRMEYNAIEIQNNKLKKEINELKNKYEELVNISKNRNLIKSNLVEKINKLNLINDQKDNELIILKNTLESINKKLILSYNRLINFSKKFKEYANKEFQINRTNLFLQGFKEFIEKLNNQKYIEKIEILEGFDSICDFINLIPLEIEILYKKILSFENDINNRKNSYSLKKNYINKNNDETKTKSDISQNKKISKYKNNKNILIFRNKEIKIKSLNIADIGNIENSIKKSNNNSKIKNFETQNNESENKLFKKYNINSELIKSSRSDNLNNLYDKNLTSLKSFQTIKDNNIKEGINLKKNSFNQNDNENNDNNFIKEENNKEISSKTKKNNSYSKNINPISKDNINKNNNISIKNKIIIKEFNVKNSDNQQQKIWFLQNGYKNNIKRKLIKSDNSLEGNKMAQYNSQNISYKKQLLNKINNLSNNRIDRKKNANSINSSISSGKKKNDSFQFN